ncbi:hypothetical protein NOX82_21060 [Pseudomonas citronellolis]|uniref:hypothetical protein n=1 Tax=Pseudomonas citronellolis TaxID=53408 RepID=UPI002112FE93|nr:hypothetical protein [Pseudomonas citronellolis]MDN6873356.1 hypothetical protein [Pseudomonas citronellolis]UUC48381.1 hypothetical protein NOX82_21060 [Pseudomonas citronellolis]
MLDVPGPLRLFLLLAIALAGLSLQAHAGNKPCSGSKGGIARCDGDLFLCNDGSISGSKRSCSAVLGTSGSARNQTGPSMQRFSGASSECGCGSGSFCTGPRGGVYCLTPGGRKSYVRK